jgi:multisubunit Na+/H+ antiporter MnhF subunit
LELSSDLIIAAAFYGLLSILLIYRVAKGPHAVDRVVAADSVDTITVVIMVLFGAISERAIYLDLALIVALLGFISTVVISRYLEGKI